MSVSVLLFAAARRWTGRGSVTLEAAPGATLRALLSDPSLAALGPHLPSLRFAVNEEFAPIEAPVKDGDTVAVLPPVSGG